ncbi:MAG: hypothetical protein H6Q90_5 [Deltaproteobacteria bacterium]|nr:hypothetical protein [Deltaproteobacteria bacterium]
MKRLLLAAVACVACKQSKPEPGTAPSSFPSTISRSGSDTVAVTAPRPDPADRIQPVKRLAWQRPARERNASEEILYGTWVAKVGEYASRSMFMADRVMLEVKARPGQDGISAIADAIAKDNQISSSCIWLELAADFSGIRRECMIVNDEPSALDQNDLATGAKQDLGTRLEWSFDATKPATLKIRFLGDMVVPAMRDGKLRQLVYHDWWLRMGKEVGDNKFEVTELFPEHDYELPTKYHYEIMPHRFLGQ